MVRTSRLFTPRSPDSVQELLATMITGNSESGSAFQGSSQEGSFEIRGVTAYRSSYLPLTRGRILSRPGGAELELTFRPHRQVLVFFSIWLSFLLLASLLITISSFTAGPLRLLLLLVPLGLAALTLTLGYRVFASDCHWVEEALEDNLKKAF